MARKQTAATPTAKPQHGYTVAKRKRSRFWDVLDPAGRLVCVTVYKRGAEEVVRRLAA